MKDCEFVFFLIDSKYVTLDQIEMLKMDRTYIVYMLKIRDVGSNGNVQNWLKMKMNCTYIVYILKIRYIGSNGYVQNGLKMNCIYIVYIHCLYILSEEPFIVHQELVE